MCAMNGAGCFWHIVFIPGNALTKIFAISNPGRFRLTSTKLRVPEVSNAWISVLR